MATVKELEAQLKGKSEELAAAQTEIAQLKEERRLNSPPAGTVGYLEDGDGKYHPGKFTESGEFELDDEGAEALDFIGSLPQTDADGFVPEGYGVPDGNVLEALAKNVADYQRVAAALEPFVTMGREHIARSNGSIDQARVDTRQIIIDPNLLIDAVLAVEPPVVAEPEPEASAEE